ncbi:MAG TPA: vitamin K epoxide reductase family protein [Candidatus Limnocylindrales bacterium]|nr:vitamin K epoxide reductase family protein [Candidatus Limnocylindrales bacterium]
MLRRSTVRPILGVHPGLLLAALDIVGLAIAGYLSAVELQGGVPACGIVKGCEEVARSEYSRIAGIPVAVFGVGLSLLLLTLAIAWWRTNLHALLLAHYGLSLAGVLFEVYFLYLQVVVIGAVCIWCTSYGLSLIARFVIALVVWVRGTEPAEPSAVDARPEGGIRRPT